MELKCMDYVCICELIKIQFHHILKGLKYEFQNRNYIYRNFKFTAK